MSDCLFCRIIAKEIPSNTVYEDELVFAFRDINPQAPSHILVIPKTHVASIAEVQDAKVMTDVMFAATQIARQEGLEAEGYRIVTNVGENAGQTVFHLHVHVLGGRTMHWPPG